jgi:hypothetical protein
MTNTSPQSIGGRVVVAIVIALAAGGWAWWVRSSGRFTFSDFDQLWIAARAVLEHQNPYATVPKQFQWPLYYPMPAVIIALPFAMLPKEWASPVWVSLGFAAFAFALSRRGWWPLILLATAPAMNAASLGQWTPLLSATALIPWLAWIGLGKPTTGAAVTGAYGLRGARLNVALAFGILLLSFLLHPAWVKEWLSGIRHARHFRPLVLRPFGFVMLASLLRWRRPEGRLLALLSLVPATLVAYDAVPLMLIPHSRREVMIFAGLATIAQSIADHVAEGQTFIAWSSQVGQIYFVALYVPCLVMVLLRPNRERPITGQEFA